MKILNYTLLFGLPVAIAGNCLHAQIDANMELHTSLPVSLTWRMDPLGINHSPIDIPAHTERFKLPAQGPGPFAEGGSNLQVRVGELSRLFMMRPGHTYHVTVNDSAIHLQSSDPYHGAYDAAQYIAASYALYGSSDTELPQHLAEISTQMDSIKAAHPGDLHLYATLDAYRALKSISPLVQSARGPEAVACFRQIENELIRQAPISYGNALYWSLLENYYTWKTNIKAFNEYPAPLGTQNLDRFKGELGIIGNDTVAQMASLAKINANYDGEGSRNAETYESMLAEIVNAPLHPAIADQAGRISKRMESMAIGRMVGDFDIHDTYGDTLALSDFAGKAMVLLDFWFVGCSPCKRDLPTLKALHAEYPERLKIIAINPLESMEMAQDYRLKQGIRYTVGLPADKLGIKEAFNVKSYPHYVLLHTDGTVAMYAGSDIDAVKAFMASAQSDPEQAISK
jgi:thiol-disulfide isomerase/thioredoxin